MTEKNSNKEELLALIIEGIEQVKGENITVLDLREIENTAAQYFVICDGNSNTQVQAISGSVQKVVSKQLRDKPWHVEGVEVAQWILMDYIDVVVHIFQKETRAYYNIEDLWGDAKIIEVSTSEK